MSGEKTHDQHTVAIVGAGPVGLELAVALKRAGIDYVQFDKGTVGQTMFWWPPQTQWFSSNERIAIAGVPLLTTDQRKATREEYLAYLRTVARTFDLKVRTHEPVTDVERDGEGFVITSKHGQRTHTCRARKLVLAVGDTEMPKRLNIPGEDLAHVTHVLEEPHKYFQRRLLIVGGKNSAVEAALRCWHAGVEVTLACRADGIDAKHVKYWLRPELIGRIKRGEIAAHFGVEPVEITPTHAVMRHVKTDARFNLDTDFVLLATGFVADMSLLRRLGVELLGDNELPTFDEDTMETNVPGVYVAGTATAGTQNRYTVFLENCHIHTDRIVHHLLGKAPPTTPEDRQMPET